jgi:predicted transcriptional regulator
MSEKALKDVRFAKARDVMEKKFVCIDGSATVADAVQLMRKESVTALIVNRRTPDDAWGIITQKDVVSKVVDPGKSVAVVYVYEIMSKPLVTVAPGLALKYCARLFRMTGIRRAPVFDGKAIVGLLSNTEIFNAISDESHLIAHVMDEDEDESSLIADVMDQDEDEDESDLIADVMDQDESDLTANVLDQDEDDLLATVQTEEPVQQGFPEKDV